MLSFFLFTSSVIVARQYDLESLLCIEDSIYLNYFYEHFALFMF